MYCTVYNSYNVGLLSLLVSKYLYDIVEMATRLALATPNLVASVVVVVAAAAAS